MAGAARSPSDRLEWQAQQRTSPLDPRQELDDLGLDLVVGGRDHLPLRIENDIDTRGRHRVHVFAKRLPDEPPAPIAFESPPDLSGRRNPDAYAAGIDREKERSE